MRIVRVKVFPMIALFEDMYGGEEKVPPHLFRPASHFRSLRRLGQYSTFVEIATDEGVNGIGEAFGLPHPSVTAAVVSNVLAPELVGRDALDAEAAFHDFLKYFEALGHTRGPMMEALSAVDIALWDIRARARDLPLCELLGGQPGEVEAYASPVPFFEKPEDSRAAASAFVREGYRAVKLKIGRGLETDLEHVEAVRDGVGPQVALMVDANCAYDVPAAIRLSRELAAFEVAWLEEPTSPDDPRGLAEVRRSSPLPIASGENEFSARGVEDLIRAEAIDIAQPNVTRAGGVTGCVEISSLCADNGLRFAPHGVGGGVGIAATLHVCVSAPNSPICEANRLPNPLRDEIVDPPIEISDGAFHVPKGLGVGAEIDLPAAERYAMGSGKHEK